MQPYALKANKEHIHFTSFLHHLRQQCLSVWENCQLFLKFANFSGKQYGNGTLLSQKNGGLMQVFAKNVPLQPLTRRESPVTHIQGWLLSQWLSVIRNWGAIGWSYDSLVLNVNLMFVDDTTFPVSWLALPMKVVSPTNVPPQKMDCIGFGVHISSPPPMLHFLSSSHPIISIVQV